MSRIDRRQLCMNRTLPHIPMARLTLGLAFVLIASFAVHGCSTGVNEPADIVFPESDVSFHRHVLPLFDVGCNFSGCHNGIDRAGNLALTSYVDLFERSGLVRPGDSARSLLVQITSSRQPHTTPIARLIYPEQAKGIAVWVEEGASNN